MENEKKWPSMGLAGRSVKEKTLSKKKRIYIKKRNKTRASESGNEGAVRTGTEGGELKKGLLRYRRLLVKHRRRSSPQKSASIGGGHSLSKGKCGDRGDDEGNLLSARNI